MFHKLIEATLGQLNTKQKSITRLFPDFFSNPVKVKGVISKGGVRLSSIQKDIWTFSVHSGTEEGLQYDVVVRWKDIEKDVQKLVSDRRNWTKDKKRADLRKVAAKLFKDGNVELSCECPAQTYYGGDYLLTQKHAKYGEPEDRSPDIRNPKKYGQYCKHVQVLMRTLPFYKTTIANWLGKEFKDLIQQAEAGATRTAQQFKAAGQALGRRVAKESQSLLLETIGDDLPPAQKKLFLYWRRRKGISKLPIGRFFLLNNGRSVVGNDETREQHSDILDAAGVSWEVQDEGAIKGDVWQDCNLDIYLSNSFEPSEGQRSAIEEVIASYNLESIYVEVGQDYHRIPGDLETRSAHILTDIVCRLLMGKTEGLERFHFKEIGEPIQEAVATLPEPQQVLLDEFGPASEEDMRTPSMYPGEEAYFKFWLLSDGTLIHVPVAHIRTALDAGTEVNELLESGAIRILVSHQHLGAENLKTITRVQRSAIVDLYLRYGPEELASEVGSEAIYSSDYLRKLLGESIQEDKKERDRKRDLLYTEVLNFLMDRGWLFAVWSKKGDFILSTPTKDEVLVEVTTPYEGQDVVVSDFEKPEPLEFYNNVCRKMLQDLQGSSVIIPSSRTQARWVENNLPSGLSLAFTGEEPEKLEVKRPTITVRWASLEAWRSAGVQESIQEADGISKELWGETTNDVLVYLVDGEEIRNTYDDDYTEGGHHFRWDFIPKDEIWIERMRDPSEHRFNLFHELYERGRMMREGTPYEEAHQKAAHVEQFLRSHPERLNAYLKMVGWEAKNV
jgi:hypothetical protein